MDETKVKQQDVAARARRHEFDADACRTRPVFHRIARLRGVPLGEATVFWRPEKLPTTALSAQRFSRPNDPDLSLPHRCETNGDRGRF